MSSYRIGIDVGGTFTDFVVYDVAARDISTFKVPTTPDDPSRGILTGLGQLPFDKSAIENISHGTTTATNLLIERKGSNAAFLVTEGHRDTLDVRRANRQELYDAQWTPPPPLVPRRNRLEIKERLTWDGGVALPLDEAQVEDVIETLKAREIEAVAICFMHSYQHPAHELRVKEMVQAALPDAFVTASYETSQEFREFERGSTVAANAFVGPKVRAYLNNLEGSLKSEGITAGVAIMQSNGGICTIEEAAQLPIKLARSGPAGGAMALQKLAELTEVPDLVGIDIGGTSADVSVIVDGRPRWASPLLVEWGMPLLFPSVDVVSIGAGGGSIAWIDEGGALQMGPHSAGAVPGPACYGQGGTEPTSTDAQLTLGRISGGLLGGDMKLDPAQATEAIAERIAGPLGMTVPDAAEGMLKILDSAMLQAIRFVTLEKGYDPRRFTLVGLGGAGPLHVVDLARELGMTTAIVPTNPGVLSAEGMLSVDMVQDRSRTVLLRRRAVDNDTLSETLNELSASIATAFARQGIAASEIRYEYFLDLQYYGQVYSLAVPLQQMAEALGPREEEAESSQDIRLSEEGVLSVPLAASSDGSISVTDDMMAGATETFHHEHQREYGHADQDQEVQIVHARVFGRVDVSKPEFEPADSSPPSPDAALTGSRTVVFDGASIETGIYDRSLLKAGNEIAGPAIIEESVSTTVLPPDSSLRVDAYGNLRIALQ
jgi:N-methylhydantoinase A